MDDVSGATSRWTALVAELGAPKNAAEHGNENMSGVLPARAPSVGRNTAVFEVSARPLDVIVR